jgi:hemolysin III
MLLFGVPPRRPAMTWLSLREPVSAWTHGAWAIGALPACVLLWRVCRGNRVKQISLSLFGGSLFLCFGSSMLYHGVRLPAGDIELCRIIDHIGIYVLIGGTVTPAAVVLLQGRWRGVTLIVAWGMSALGIALLLVWPTAPPWVYTLLYMGIGWGVCLGYFEMARVLPPGGMRPVWLGGLLYTVGALLNLVGWPQLVPGVFSTHELWHVFVMAGSFCHFWFMVRFVAPFERRRADPALALASIIDEARLSHISPAASLGVPLH